MTEKKRGAPEFEFDQAIADEICERIVTSRHSVDRILADTPGAPGRTTLHKWLDGNDQFAKQYAAAKQLQADYFADLAVEESFKERPYAEKGGMKDNVQRSQLIVQTLLKRAGQLNSKKYGDKIQNEHSGPDGGPIEVEDVREKLAARLAIAATPQSSGE